MYKAIHAVTGEEVIILHPRWRAKVDQLRGLDHGDLLVCQSCRQPMRVKAGRVKRPHFAHKHLKACSYGTESPEILQARAVLYEWLFKWFGDGVTVEKQMEGVQLPRPVDCWVEARQGIFAYWIFEAGIQLDTRIIIKNAFENQPVKIHWVFLIDMLHEEKKEFHSLLLSPTERTFLQATVFDQTYSTGLGEAGRSLHYLDSGAQQLTTYRGLTLYHAPNWFRGLKKTSPLDDVRPSMVDGEFAHSGEADRLSDYRRKQQRLEQKRKSFEEKQADWARRMESQPPRFAWRDRSPEPKVREPEALTCITCGKVTTNYWSTFFDEQGQKWCRCRDCLDG